VLVVLGDVMVSVLAIVAKIRGFKPGRGDELRGVIKIHSTPSFRGEVGLKVHVVRFYGMDKQKYFARPNSHLFLPFPMLATR
jgi:hypothetical protein